MSKLGHYDNHPAYRYQAVQVFSDLKFGRDRETPPNIEGEFARGGPWFTGLTPITLFDDGVNPVGAIFEPLTDDVFGAGLAEADLHQASFESIRTALFNDGLRISIDQGDQTDLRSYLAEVLELFDGFLFRTGTQLGIGRWAQGNINTTSLPVVGSTDLYSEPRVKSTGWDDALTEVNVVFRDREHYFHDTPAVVRNPGLFQSLGEFRTVTLQKKFLIDATMANRYATQYLQRFARPGMSGELDVKLEKVEAIEDAAGQPIIGQLIKTDVASLGYELIFRVLECEYPGDDGPFFCSLTVELERSIWPTIFVQPPPPRIGNFVVDVPNIVNRKIVELPSGLKTESALQVAILAQRPAKNIVGFHVYHSTDNVIYVPDNPACTFAAYGKLTSAYLSSTTDVDQLVGMQFNLFGVDLVPDSTGHLLDYTVLCFVDNEIMSVGKLFALGGGVYKTWMYRGRYGTLKATHAIGATAFFILREDLVPIANKNFAVGSTIWFKLQPFDSHQDFDLASVTPFSYLFVGNAVSGISNLSLTTSAVVTSDGKVDSRVFAVWNYVGDQLIRYFNVSIRKTGETSWVTAQQGSEVVAKWTLLSPGTSYDVRVQAINVHGEPSAWSETSTIISANLPTPGAPTGLVVTPGVQSINVTWAKTASNPAAVAKTQILRGPTSTFAFAAVIGEIGPDTTSFNDPNSALNVGWFYWVRHVSNLDVNGTAAGPQFGASIAPIGKQCATPMIIYGPTGSGTIGTANFRVQLVDLQGSAGPADLFFAINDGAFVAYSMTGNYKSTTTGAVLPTGGAGEISLGIGDKVVAYARQTGWLQSATSLPLINNATNSPTRDGAGTVGGGTAVTKVPY